MSVSLSIVLIVDLFGGLFLVRGLIEYDIATAVGLLIDMAY